MTASVITNILRWFLLVGVQVLVLNNIYLGGIFNPYLYVLIILSLPIEMSGLLVLLIGFFTGFTIDVLSHTMGLHTMSLTLLAYLRPMVLSLIEPRDGFEFGSKASIGDFGWSKYLVYATLLVFIHHLVLFLLEGFSTGMMWLAVQKTVLNTMVTIALVVLIQSFTSVKRKV